jgi:hypothetical protein
MVAMFDFYQIKQDRIRHVTKFMFLVLILNPKRQPWQGNILVRENIIINMVDTGILISFHNY